MALRTFMALTVKRVLHTLQQPSLHTSKFVIMAVAVQTRNISSLEVTKNLSLLSAEKNDSKIINLQLEKPVDKPLVVLLSWLMAKKKHVYKYADLYLRNGFDVLNVSVTPWQLLWPTKRDAACGQGPAKVHRHQHEIFPLVLHGFSVGGYVWGEVLVNIAAERERYAQVVDRIVGQIWDSAADITEMPVGVPISVFPRNLVMQTALKQYMLYHLKTFDKVATRHYVRSSQMFHTNLVHAPAQFFLSKADPIGTEASNQRVRESWESMGVQV
ncbi:hypothetical protein NQ317_001972, partial [Molorchus minor]